MSDRTKYITIRVKSSPYEDHDNCLAAAEHDACDRRDLAGWDLSPRWEDDRNRDYILLDVPDYALLGDDRVVDDDRE